MGESTRHDTLKVIGAVTELAEPFIDNIGLDDYSRRASWLQINMNNFKKNRNDSV